MPSKPKPPPEPPRGSEDFDRFKELTRKLLAVPNKEVDGMKPTKRSRKTKRSAGS